MRNVLLAASLAASLAACGTELDQFEVPVEGATTVQGSPLPAEISGALPPIAGFTKIQLTDSQEFKNQGVSADDIDEVKLTELVLEVQDPADGNLDFMDKVEFWAEAPGQEKIKIAEKQQMPDGERRVSLDVSGVDLKPYVVSEEMTVSTVVDGTLPAEDTKVGVKAVFLVDVAVF